MPDDYGSRYTEAYTFPLPPGSNRLSSGILYGQVGPDDNNDEDWFQVRLLKGATYQFTLKGGISIYDLNWGELEFYSTNGTSYIGGNSFHYYTSSQSGTISASLKTGPITTTGDYYLKTGLYSISTGVEAGSYSLQVEQLTEGITSYLTKSNQQTMNDDYGSRYTSAFNFPLTTNSYGLNQGSLTGVIGPDDNNDEDWFKVRLLKGATYEFTLKGGVNVYDLNWGELEFYNMNGTSYLAGNSFHYYTSSQSGTTSASLKTGPITVTGDYYLKTALYSVSTGVEVGSYTLDVEQLTKGFGEPTPTTTTTSPRPTNISPNTSAGANPSTNTNQTINNYYGDYINQSGNSGVINNQQNNSGTINNTQTNTVSIGQLIAANNYTPDQFSYGGKSSDSLSGTSENDFITGKSGSDYISGGDGNDELIGGSGADDIYGGAGSNIINAGGSSRDADDIYISDKTESTSADIIKSCGAKDRIYVDSEDFFVDNVDGGFAIFNEADTMLAVYTGTKLTITQFERLIYSW